MEKLISYQEYKDIIGIKPSVVEDEFNQMQLLALSYIKNSMAQIQIFPESQNIFKYLKQEYKDLFVQALGFEIDYLGTNRNLLLESPISLLQSMSTGSYSSGPVGSGDVIKFQSRLSPITYQILTDMGWLYCSIDSKYEPSVFYNSVYLEYIGTEKFEVKAGELTYLTFQVILDTMLEPLEITDIRVNVESSFFSLVIDPENPTLIKLRGTPPIGGIMVKLDIRLRSDPQVALKKNIFVVGV